MAPNEKLAWELPVWLVVFLMLLSRFSFCFWLLIVWLWYFDWGVDIMVFVLLRVCQASYMCWSGFCQVWWVISHYFFDYTFWPFSSLFSCSFRHCMWRCILVRLTVSTSLWHFFSTLPYGVCRLWTKYGFPPSHKMAAIGIPGTFLFIQDGQGKPLSQTYDVKSFPLVLLGHTLID